MNTQSLLIISAVVGVLLLILGILISYFSKKKSKVKTKQVVDQQILKEKQFFKQFKPIKFKKWNKYESGIVISCGKYKRNSIDNKFVIKNLKKKNSKKIKKLDYKKLSVCISDKKSSIVIAPPGSGKTQALLLPTILYMINCKEKPNLIIADPKPEINQLVNNELIKNQYIIINLSTREIINSNNEFETDFWNMFDDIIKFHKKLMEEKNDLYAAQNYVSKIISELDKITSYLKNDETQDYWRDNGLLIVNFLVFYILYKIEIGDWDYKYLNFFNLKNNLNVSNSEDLRKMFKELLNTNSFSREMGVLFSGWINERDENVSSFLTNTLKFLNTFNNSYLAMLTSRTTFDLDKIIQSDKPFAIFLTINTSTNAHITEKSLLKIYLSMINAKISYYKNINSNFRNRSLWWLLDEVGNIPELDFLKMVISFGRGENQFALPIFQSYSQMKRIYDVELIESCENTILFNNHNIELAKAISTLSGQYEQEFEDGKTIKNNNIEIENICNIPSGYLGLFKYKRNNNEKVFNILPVTYFYMMKNIKTDSNLRSNRQYLLNEYRKDIYPKKVSNDENEQLENSTNKSRWFKYWYLNIDSELVFSSPDKSRCIQLLNSIQIDLDYFRFNESIDIKKIEKINERFSLLQKILNNELSDSLIAKFLNLANNNKNILYGESLEKIGEMYEKQKTKEN